MTSISTHRLIVSFACACTTSSFLTANDATLGILLFVKSVKSVCGVNMCISLSFCDQKKIVRSCIFCSPLCFVRPRAKHQNQTFSLYFVIIITTTTMAPHQPTTPQSATKSSSSFFRTTNRVNSWRSRRRRDWQRVFVSTDGIARFGR